MSVTFCALTHDRPRLLCWQVEAVIAVWPPYDVTDMGFRPLVKSLPQEIFSTSVRDRPHREPSMAHLSTASLSADLTPMLIS
jgi:hypothetical protein